MDIKTLETRQADTLVDIGLTRLPILVRVADFAEHLETLRKQGKQIQIDSALFEYLGYHPWQGSFPTFEKEELNKADLHLLITDALRRGRAVIIIDGLDEVANPQQRCNIASHVDRFAWQWIYNLAGTPYDSVSAKNRLIMISKALSTLGRPVDQGGNQIIVTSRIAGYHSAPMQSPLTHVTIQPMEIISIKSFCNSWMIAVHTIEDRGATDLKRIETDALSESKKLYQIIIEQEGVRKLAQNPLLLTILALVFRKQKNLPKLRAQLYRVAMSILVNVWRDCNMSLNDIIITLAPLAAFLHANRPMGLISENDLRNHILEAKQNMILTNTNIPDKDNDATPGDDNDDDDDDIIQQDKHTKSISDISEYQNQQLIKEVDQFVKVLSEQVGFLVARGESMFGFLHQSFQEYLAGWHLIGGESACYGIKQAAKNFISRLGDARWREPLLLALGIISELWDIKKIEKFLHIVIEIDSNSNSLMPRASLLIMTAWKEMKIMPAIIANRIQILLLYSFSKQNKYDKNSIELIRYKIETSFKELIVTEKNSVIQLFINILRTPKRYIKLALNSTMMDDKTSSSSSSSSSSKISLDCIKNFCCACAEIIVTLGIFSNDLFFALHDARYYDQSKWKWIIHQCLRRFVSPKFPETFAKSIHASTSSHITLPIHEIVFNNIEITNYKKKSLLVSLCGGFQDFNVTATTGEYYNYVKFLHRDCTSRDDLGKMEISLYRWTSKDDIAYNIAVYLDTFIPKKFWSITPKFSLLSIHCWPELPSILKKRLYTDDNLIFLLFYLLNDYPNHEISDISKTIFSYLSLLNMPYKQQQQQQQQSDQQVVKEGEENKSEEQNQENNTSITTNESSSSSSTGFTITKDFSLLLTKDDLLSNEEFLALKDENIKLIKTQALISLISLGVDLDLLFQLPSIKENCNLQQLDCSLHSVRDPAARSRYKQLFTYLEKLSQKYFGYDFEQIFISIVFLVTKALHLLDIGNIIKAVNSNTGEQIKLLDLINNRRNRGIIYGLYLLDRVSSLNSDDRVYRATLSADSLVHIEFQDFVLGLSFLGQLHTQIAYDVPLVDPWPLLDPCTPFWEEDELLPPEALNSLEHVYFSWWIEAAIKRLYQQFTISCPDLLTEILTVYYVCTDHQTGADIFGGLAPDSNYSLHPLESLCCAASNIEDPYYRSRAIWRICRYFPSIDDAFLHSALESSEEIPDIHRQVYIKEKILSLFPIAYARRKFEILCELVEQIDDLNNRSRAYARLSMSPILQNKTKQREMLLEKAIQTADQIENKSLRSILLNEIRISISRNENCNSVNSTNNLTSLLKTTIKKLQLPRYIHYAKGLKGHVLFSAHTDIDPSEHDAWLALSLYGMFYDAIMISSNDTTWEIKLWSSLLDDRYHVRAYQALCDHAVAPDSNGLTLDPSAILALDLLMSKAIELSKNIVNHDEAIDLYKRIYTLFYLLGDACNDVRKYVMVWCRRYINRPKPNNYEPSPSSLLLLNTLNTDDDDDDNTIFDLANYNKSQNTTNSISKLNLIYEWEQKVLQQISLLAVEQGILNVEILQPILHLLQFGDDRSRIRVELALDGHYCCTANSFRRWRTSELGFDLLIQLAEASWNATTNHIKIQTETIGWMAHDLIHDSPEIIKRLVSLAELATNDHEWYVSSLWLRKGECFTEDVWEVWIHFLIMNNASERIQEMMLGTVCKTAATTTNCSANWPENAFEKLQEIQMNPNVLNKLTVLTDWPGSVSVAALETLHLNIESTSDRIQKANDIISDMLQRNPVKNVLHSRKELADFGHAYYFLLRSSYPGERSVPTAVEKLMNTPEILSTVILPWLQFTLESPCKHKSFDNPSEFRKEIALLEIAAGLAERLPVTYQNCTTPYLASLISKSVKENDSSFGRVAAVELLTKYGTVSKDTISAMKCALLDNMFVSERALACAKEFRYLDDRLLDFLINELYHPFASINLAAANILAGVYSEVATTSEQREKILNALTGVVQYGEVKNKFIFAIINPGKKSSQTHATVTKIYCLGSLEQSLFLALSSVCGFTS